MKRESRYIYSNKHHHHLPPFFYVESTAWGEPRLHAWDVPDHGTPQQASISVGNVVAVDREIASSK